jgi:selenocysteine-specific elongation factor
VDRVFTLQGFGTVVTGTLWSGTLRPGDPVTILPEGIETRIKTVQVHDHEVAAAGAGQRVAVSLHRVEKERLSRGDWIVRSEVLRPSLMMDGWLSHLRSAPRAMKNRARVRVHLGASELLARVLLLDRDELRPGDRAPVQLRLESPGVAESGDRFVVRSYSPMRATGGGVIVEPVAAKRRRLIGDPAEELRRREAGTPRDRLVDLLLPRGLEGESAKNLRASLGLDGPAFSALAAAAREEGKVVGDNRLFLPAALAEAGSLVESTVAAYHAQHPVAWGIPLGDLKSGLGTSMNPALFDLARHKLEGQGTLVLRGELARLAAHDPTLSHADQAHAERLVAILEDGGFSAPFVGHVMTSLGVDDTTGHDLLSRLALEGRVVVVSNEFVYPAPQLDLLRERLRAHFVSEEELSVAAFKDLADGLSRKHAVPLLEFCDRQGWTRRSGDGRISGPALG